MKRMFLYAALPFLPLLLSLGSSSADGAVASPAASPAHSGPPSAIVLCHAYDGDACSPEGFTFVCYNHYPDEPGLCECTGGLWSCS